MFAFDRTSTTIHKSKCLSTLPNLHSYRFPLHGCHCAAIVSLYCKSIFIYIHCKSIYICRYAKPFLTHFLCLTAWKKKNPKTAREIQPPKGTPKNAPKMPKCQKNAKYKKKCQKNAKKMPKKCQKNAKKMPKCATLTQKPHLTSLPLWPPAPTPPPPHHHPHSTTPTAPPPHHHPKPSHPHPTTLSFNKPAPTKVQNKPHLICYGCFFCEWW